MTKEDFYKGQMKNRRVKPELGLQRQRSRELDFGVHWRKLSIFPTYRVTWVENTGEVITVDLHQNTYEILGKIKTEEEVEKRFKGWADACGPANSLYWITKKIENAKAI